MKITKILLLMATLALATACSSGGDTPNTPDAPETTVPVELRIAVPMATATRVGDPGSSTGETVDWDRMAIIIAYKTKTNTSDDQSATTKKMVYWDTFSRKEFESTTTTTHATSTLTPVFNGATDTGVRSFVMSLPPGTVRIYGVTYSEPDEGETYATHNLVDFEERLKGIAKDGANHNADILAWQMPNSYTTDGTPATMDVAKFLSVATGYAVDGSGTTPKYDLEITSGTDGATQNWSMTLHRLAAKLDIQWDAQSAYDNTKGQYIDVQMDGFTYNGGAALADGDMGHGLVFPYTAIQTSTTFAPLGGKATFYNTTPISKRNGRVYHYIFPDLNNTSGKPAKIEFTIASTSKSADGTSTSTATTSRTFSFEKVAPIQPSTWYKINAKVKGNTSSTEIVIDRFNTGN